MSKTIPIVQIPSVELHNSHYVYGNKKWSVPKLIEAAKDEPVFDMPLAGIKLDITPWEIPYLGEFIYHMKRCADASLEHPIILDDQGVIADGAHRVAKAIVLGKTTIKAVRLQEMPSACEVKIED